MFNKKNNNKVHKLSTFKEKLSEVQTTLLAFDFELMEIWSPDEGNDKEVWFNEKKNNLFEMSVKEIMTKNPVSIDKDSLAVKALRLMNEKKITSLCVHAKKNKNKTIGILHIHTLLESSIN